MEHQQGELRPPQIHFFSLFLRFRFSWPHPPTPIAQYPTFRRFKRLAFVGAQYRREEKGHRAKWATAERGGPPRNLAEPQQEGLTPSNPLFSRFLRFRSSRPSPFPNTQRVGGFETPGIGWCVECRSEEKGHLAQWATAEPGGAPRNLAGPHGTPTGWNYALKSTFLSRLTRFRPSRVRLPSALPRCPTFRRFRNAWYWLARGI